MPVNLSVKNVPEALAQRLRERAEGNHRSLQRELVSILEQAVSDNARLVAERGVPGPIGRPIEEIIAASRALFVRARSGGDAAVDLVRQMRDARYGASSAKRSRRTGSG